MAVILCKVLPEPGYKTMIAIILHSYRVSSIYRKPSFIFSFFFQTHKGIGSGLGIRRYPKSSYRNQYQDRRNGIGTLLYLLAVYFLDNDLLCSLIFILILDQHYTACVDMCKPGGILYAIFVILFCQYNNQPPATAQ